MALKALKSEDQIQEALEDLRIAAGHVASDKRYWEELAKSNARAHNRVEDERFALLQENKELRRRLEAAQSAYDASPFSNL